MKLDKAELTRVDRCVSGIEVSTNNLRYALDLLKEDPDKNKPQLENIQMDLQQIAILKSIIDRVFLKAMKRSKEDYKPKEVQK